MNSTSTSQHETRIGRYPVIWFFALAYAISWPFWLLSHLAGGTLGVVLIVIGGFGPMLAAAIVISRTGGSLSGWLRSILRWRVSPVYYAYALGLPVLLAVILNLALAVLGEQPDVSLVVERVPAYLQTLLLTAVIFGGQEEPGWRGFALPRLQQRHSAAGRHAAPRLGLGDLARPAVRPSRVRSAAGARLLLHVAVQQDQKRLAVHPAACQLHPRPRSPAADRRLARWLTRCCCPPTCWVSACSSRSPEDGSATRARSRTQAAATMTDRRPTRQIHLERRHARDVPAPAAPEKAMAVHLESQHRLNVAPGILHRSSLPAASVLTSSSRRPNCPLSSSLRKSITGSAEPVSMALSANGITGPKDSPAGFKPVYGAPSPAR